jgi:hypothetical protein
LVIALIVVVVVVGVGLVVVVLGLAVVVVVSFGVLVVVVVDGSVVVDFDFVVVVEDFVSDEAEAMESVFGSFFGVIAPTTMRNRNEAATTQEMMVLDFVVHCFLVQRSASPTGKQQNTDRAISAAASYHLGLFFATTESGGGGRMSGTSPRLDSSSMQFPPL